MRLPDTAPSAQTKALFHPNDQPPISFESIPSYSNIPPPSHTPFQHPTLQRRTNEDKLQNKPKQLLINPQPVQGQAQMQPQQKAQQNAPTSSSPSPTLHKDPPFEATIKPKAKVRKSATPARSLRSQSTTHLNKAPAEILKDKIQEMKSKNVMKKNIPPKTKGTPAKRGRRIKKENEDAPSTDEQAQNQGNSQMNKDNEIIIDSDPEDQQDLDYQQIDDDDEDDEEDEIESVRRKLKYSNELQSKIKDKKAHERYEKARAQTSFRRAKLNPALQYQDDENLKGLRTIDKPIFINPDTGIEIVSVGLAESIKAMNQKAQSSSRKRGAKSTLPAQQLNSGAGGATIPGPSPSSQKEALNL
ncbi:MAG: hypothetical protein EZS28_035002 [Streblomastix strix]|uniref:Uncharacterized protein n=1 Tax=Streblomastix strix TaxID=222440 RepID=A0A5J4UHR2_9EUKA|nr:MAG: hypothetical protein EZS28_035002 [Streblomastix strix]